MVLIDRKVCAILVTYDPERALQAEGRLREILSGLELLHSIFVISNNADCPACLYGSNEVGEFSGWDEALNQIRIEEYSYFVFANDTFFLHDVGELAVLRGLRRIVHGYREGAFIWGEVSYFASFRNVLNFRPWMHKWVRTSFFLMSRCAIERLCTISTDILELEVNPERRGVFFQGNTGSLHTLIVQRVQDWVFPDDALRGWPKLSTATRDRVILKAKCVYCELMLTKRCLECGIAILPTNRMRSIRVLALEILFRLQRVLF